MGIKNIKPFLKEAAPDTFVTMSMVNLSGYRIAIDANYLMYVIKSRANGRVINSTDLSKDLCLDNEEVNKVWVKMLIDMIMMFLNCNITPVFVFDGEHPKEKDQTKQVRQNAREERKNKINNLTEKMKGDLLDRKPCDVKELENLIKNDLTFTKKDYELFANVLLNLGVPCLYAEADGEQLCCMLCIEGKVAAVYSSDTDTLAYGCPLTITKVFENRHSPPAVECMVISNALTKLEIDYPTFLDLCIMCGCDFNNNIPKIGCKRAFGLLKEHKSIDNITSKYDTSILNYKRCRDIFSYKTSESLIRNETYSLEMDRSEPERTLSFFKLYDMEPQYGNFSVSVKRLGTPKDMVREVMSFE